MFKLDNNFLISMGLGSLPVDEKNKLLQAIYERLEMNVGMRLAEKMTEQQLTEFEQFMDQKDEAGALRWLETNFPNYKQVVAEELDKLKNEVMQSAPQILAASAPQSQQSAQLPTQGVATQPGISQTSATSPTPLAQTEMPTTSLQPQPFSQQVPPVATSAPQTDFSQPVTPMQTQPPTPDPTPVVQPAYDFNQPAPAQPTLQANDQFSSDQTPLQPLNQNTQQPQSQTPSSLPPEPPSQWPPLEEQPPAGPGPQVS